MKPSDHFSPVERYDRLFCILIPVIMALLFFISCKQYNPVYTKGPGSYPGNEKESYAPVLETDSQNYRNIALYRPAWHSSSYDYNLTAQLVTDGITDTILPLTYQVMTSTRGILPKQERGNLIDRHPMSGVHMNRPEGWMIVSVSDKKKLDPVDSVTVSGSLLYDDHKPKGWKYVISGSDDGENWTTMGTISGNDYPGEPLPEGWRRWQPANMRLFNASVKLNRQYHFSEYKLEFKCAAVINWNFTEFALLNQAGRIKIGGPYSFTSAWMSEGTRSEWIYVDLGEGCWFDSISLHWIHAGSPVDISVSDDAINWKSVGNIGGNKGLLSTMRLENRAKGRYIRLSMEDPERIYPYILSELEVFGSGGPVAIPKEQPAVGKDGRLYLAGGNWKIQRESLVRNTAEEIASAGYDDTGWIAATVPATVLMSYYNIGALPDPDFGDNQLMISESFFYSDFWYRTEFMVPETYTGRNVFLNFDGINWKADVYLNGKKTGRIEGAFMRGKFNISESLIPGEINTLAVEIIKNARPGFVKEQTKYHPGMNGGETGADNPTFHASVGWDWIPTIRGRNTGIWNDVYLTSTGPVAIVDPFISYDLPLPDTTRADIHLSLRLKNSSRQDVKGMLEGRIGPVKFSFPTEIKANSTKDLIFDPMVSSDFIWKDPVLWWPNGYGNPQLYDVKILFKTADHKVSDEITFKTGVREMTYTEDDNILKIYVNGHRFSGRGGNWGFSESNLCYRAREYDIAVRYHRDMNFTMIRNWVGQTGDEEFYEACDRYGIMIWQDFWLANPVDGPNPYDNEMFLSNAADYLCRIRNHPSIALYCGRNEGNPPEAIDTALRGLVATIHPDLHYISHSSEGVVSGYGPYSVMPVEYYFRYRALPRIHSEIGMPNIVNMESLRQMMPDSSLWPQGNMWGMHDFCLNGAQRAASFKAYIDTAFGPIDNAEEWVTLAQWLNFKGYRAIFEAQGKYRMGAQLWMSHPAWPSLVWQTYDYYFDPTAAYFACKKACEPIHIQWNALTDSIEVVNYSYWKETDLSTLIQIINLDGSVLLEEEIALESPEDSRQVLAIHPHPEGLSEVYFLRLRLYKEETLLSENIYWQPLKNGDLSVLRKIPDIEPDITTKSSRKNGNWYLISTLKNHSEHPALMVHLKVVGDKSGKRMLPVIFSDNYLTILPGENAIVNMEIKNEDTRGEKPVIILDGINIR